MDTKEGNKDARTRFFANLPGGYGEKGNPAV
jgi:hypothetical protein